MAGKLLAPQAISVHQDQVVLYNGITFNLGSIMAQDLITNIKSISTLKKLQQAYRELPFYKRLLFRIATFPFSLWSWSTSKNPATINPEETTQQDLRGLLYFFQHCQPAFLRSVFGIMEIFVNSTLYQQLMPTKQQKSKTTKAPPKNPPADLSRLATHTLSPSHSATNGRLAQVVTPQLSFFTSPPVSPENFMQDFFKKGELDEEICQQIRANFNQLEHTAYTKDACNTYKLIGALLLINNPQCFAIADDLMSSTLPTNDADKHIWSVRFKTNSIIKQMTGAVDSKLEHQVNDIWQPFNHALMESLTADELNTISDPLVFRRIIESVLIPDTLMMGMHPLENSVLNERRSIAFNPRIQFIDMSWETALKRYQGDLSQDILDEFNRRTLSLDYSDPDYFSPFVRFIFNHDQHYQRIIFDWSSLCGVDHGFLYLQRVLKPNRKIYVQETESRFSLQRMPAFPIASKKYPIPGKMLGHPCHSETIDIQDRWFVIHANHPHHKERLDFYAYERSHLPFDVENDKVSSALVERAKEKLQEFHGNIDRTISALIGKDTTRIQATQAVQLAQGDDATNSRMT